MSLSRDVQGVIRNAFYTPNQRCENIDSFFDKDPRKESAIYNYELNEKGELVVTRIRK